MEDQRRNVEEDASGNCGSEALDQCVRVLVDGRDGQTDEDIADNDHEGSPRHVALEEGGLCRADVSRCQVDDSIDYGTGRVKRHVADMERAALGLEKRLIVNSSAGADCGLEDEQEICG